MKKIYLIGGYVRDELVSKYYPELNIKPNDKDYVAVGYTEEEMDKLYGRKHGKQFPVWVDKDGNEIALARTERKIGNKHTDFEFIFSPKTTLKEDCERRNHTINAIAKDLETGEYIDYYNGINDIKNKIIRCINPKTFVQDPLRVLILYRQMAKLNFTIDPITEELCRKMVRAGMLEHLTPERIWKEIEKALSTNYKSENFFYGMRECGALTTILPELDRLFETPEKLEFHPSGNSGKHTMIALSRVEDCSPLVKWAVCCHDLGKGTTPAEILPAHHDHDIRGLDIIDTICDRLKIPNEYRNFAKLFCKTHMRIIKINNMSLKKQYDLVSELSDNFKDVKLLTNIQQAFRADFYGENKEYTEEDHNLYRSTLEKIDKIFWIMNNVTVDKLPQEYQDSLAKFNGKKFGELLREYKIRYLRDKLK